MFRGGARDRAAAKPLGTEGRPRNAERHEGGGQLPPVKIASLADAQGQWMGDRLAVALIARGPSLADCPVDRGIAPNRARFIPGLVS